MNDVRLVATNPVDSSLVPVATNARGELAVQSPKIESVPNDFDVNGDLTVTGSATVSGTASFSGDVTISEPGVGSINLYKSGHIRSYRGTNTADDSLLELRSNIGGAAVTKAQVFADGSASFAGDVQTGAQDFASTSANGARLNKNGILYLQRSGVGGAIAIYKGTDENITLKTDGSANFSGDVVIGSRNKKWMLVEQGGLCHMVEQVRATTAAAEYPKLRDVFAELNVIEKALEEVMTKLRMTEPDGWPVWDGSSNSR